jgi:hypothetical protein
MLYNVKIIVNIEKNVQNIKPINKQNLNIEEKLHLNLTLPEFSTITYKVKAQVAYP